MKKLLTTTALIASIVASGAAHAAQAAATGDASVTIQGTLDIVQTQALTFGTITAQRSSSAKLNVGMSGGTTAYNWTGPRTGAKPAIFTITGTPNMAIGSVTASTTHIRLVNSQDSSKYFNAKISDLSNNNLRSITQLDSSGKAEVKIGGWIKPAGHTGYYTGNYSVTVHY